MKMPHSDLLLRGARRTAQPLPRPAPTLPPPSGHPHIGAEGMFLLGCYLPVIADGRLSPWGAGLLSSLPLQIAQQVKNPPAMQETLVQFLGWEDLLEKG